MAKILLVEDDMSLSQTIQDWLQLERHDVTPVYNGEDAVNSLSDSQFDLLILDWQLPVLSGIEVCEHYRKSGGRAPVLMLTGRGSIQDKEDGFESGADDYLTKPFNLRELTARMTALLRRR